jgi:hypothetical protein
MTIDADNLPRPAARALARLMERALEGSHTLYYPGQEFYILAHLPDGAVKPSPAHFRSPEEAAAFLVLAGPDLEEMMPEDTRYSIALKTHPIVQ